MWYYNLNNQPTGPVDVDTLRRLMQSGVISPETLVWRQGMPAWQKLCDTGILAAPFPQQGGYPAMQQAQAGVGMYTPIPAGAMTTAQVKNPYITWLVFYGLSILFSYTSVYIMSWIDSIYARSTAIGVIAFALSLTTGILLLVSLGRFWRVIQDGVTPISAGKAVGFLFIPFFNFYWVFQAFHGLSREMNHFIDRHFQNQTHFPQRKTISAVSLVYCILFEINLVYQIYYYIRLYSGNGYGLEAMQTAAIVNGVFSLISVATAVFMMTDFYLTARNILQNRNR